MLQYESARTLPSAATRQGAQRQVADPGGTQERRSVAKTVPRQSASEHFLIDSNETCANMRHLVCGTRRRMLRDPAARRRKCGIPTRGGQGGFTVILASFFDFMGILASLVFPDDAG